MSFEQPRSLRGINDALTEFISAEIERLPLTGSIPVLKREQIAGFDFVEESKKYQNSYIWTEGILEFIGAFASSLDSRETRSRFRRGLYARYAALRSSYRQLEPAITCTARNRRLPSNASAEQVISDVTLFYVNAIGCVDFLAVEFAREKNKTSSEAWDLKSSSTMFGNQKLKKFLSDEDLDGVLRDQIKWISQMRTIFRNSIAHRELVSPVQEFIIDQEAFDDEVVNVAFEVKQCLEASEAVYDNDSFESIIEKRMQKLDVLYEYFPCFHHLETDKYRPALSVLADNYLRLSRLLLQLLGILHSRLVLHRSHVRWADELFIGYVPDRVDFENRTASFDVRYKPRLYSDGLLQVQVRSRLSSKRGV